MKGLTGRLAGAALAVSLVTGSAASAAQPVTAPCLQPHEAEDLVVFVLPALMEAMARKCAPLLPASATLTRSGAAIATRYRPASLAAWPSARIAFTKISGDTPIEFLSEDVTRQVVEQASTAAIVADFKTKDCAMVDRFVDALSPLPARNVAQLVSLLIEVSDKEDRLAMNICPAGTAR